MSSPSSTPSPSAKKICFVCGEDCAGKPRLKDPEGRYCCKGCEGKAAGASKPQVVVKSAHVPRSAAAGIAAGAASTSAATPTSPSGSMGFDEDPIDFGSMTEAPAVVSNFVPCPGCNAPTAKGSAICMSCGCNLITGKKAKVKVSKERESNGAVTDALFKSNPLMWIIGGVIGGGIGAAIWAAVAASIGYESGWIALGVGFLTGLGVVLVAREKAGVATGGVAIVIALVAILVGKYSANSMDLDNIEAKLRSTNQSEVDDTLKLILAKGLVAEKGIGTLTFSEIKRTERASRYSSLPSHLRQRIDSMFAAFDPKERDDLKKELLDDIAANGDKYKSEGFSASFSLFDILWFILASTIAFQVGSNGQKL